MELQNKELIEKLIQILLDSNYGDIDDPVSKLNESLIIELKSQKHLSVKEVYLTNYNALEVINKQVNKKFLFWFTSCDIIEIESEGEFDKGNYEYTEGPKITVDNIEETFNKYLSFIDFSK